MQNLRIINNSKTIVALSSASARTVRQEPRIKLAVSLTLRRPELAPNFSKQVLTRDVCISGVGVLLEHPLTIDTELEVTTPTGFIAIARVAHSTRQSTGKFLIGLNFINKNGKWLVIESR